MKTSFINTILSAIVMFLVIGCSGGGGGDSSSDGGSPSAEVLTGVFLDAPVEGLYFQSTSQSGYTDSKGRFSYRDSERVTFKLGNLTLGSALGSPMITPLSLSGDTSFTSLSIETTNIARVLQSLSENSDDSRLVIPVLLRNLDLSGLALNSEADLPIIISRANNITGQNKVLIDATTATTAMKSNIQDEVIGTYDGEFTLNNQLVDSSLFTCFSSGASSVNITSYDSNRLLANGLVEGSSISFFIYGIDNTTTSSSDYTLTNLTLNGSSIVGSYTIKANNVDACSGTFSFTKRVSDTTPPVFTSPSSITVNENQTSAITLLATDTSNVTYSISGSDISYFNINESTGQVTFKNNADYEIKSTYTFVATATDTNGNISTKEVTILVTDEIDAPPTFYSSSNYNFIEGNALNIHLNVIGSSSLIYSIGGEDSSIFNIVDNIISANFVPDYQNPIDLDLNNIYKITVRVTDTAENFTEHNLTINILPTYVQSGVVDSNSTIIDNRTKLMWEDSMRTIELRSDSQPPVYCENLIYAGFDDWRLPTLEEFSYIVDSNIRTKTIDTFIYFIDDYHRTSSYYSRPPRGFTIPRAEYYFITLSGLTKKVDWAYIDTYYTKCVRDID